jgi:hypothetical protein
MSNVIGKFTIKNSSNKQGASEELESHTRLLQNMIDDMIVDPSHILPMYTTLQARKAAQAAVSKSKVAKDAVLFEKLTTFGSIDDDYKGTWITTNSDLSAQDLVSAVQHDPQALDQIMTYAIQVNSKAKMPPQLQTCEVMTMFLDDRLMSCGDRLRTFKASKTIVGGKLCFREASYQLEFNDKDVLTKIVHRSTKAAAKVEPTFNISMCWTLVSNFDDYVAHVVRPPMPPIRLCTFFDAAVGPNSVVNYAGKPKVLQAKADEMFLGWEQNQIDNLNKFTPSEAVQKALADHKKIKSKQSMDKARAAAKAANLKRGERVSIKLKT